jgi:hypothetical protein
MMPHSGVPIKDAEKRYKVCLHNKLCEPITARVTSQKLPGAALEPATRYPFSRSQAESANQSECIRASALTKVFTVLL